MRGLAWCLAGVVAGCGPAIRADFDSPEPAARNAAIVDAAARGDESAVPELVRMLDSDDAATRLLAIQSLERLTGERLGFDPAGNPVQRNAAVERWEAEVRAAETSRRGGPTR